MEAIGKVAILCGGRGTRLQERTHSIPKALVEIGGRPILWHVIRIYAAQGLRRFVLLTGYLGEKIEEYTAAEDWPEGVEIECVDTGVDTPTGGRIKLAADRFGDETFCATYADGVADVDLQALVRFHRDHGDDATVTVVRPLIAVRGRRARRAGRVAGFQEKPRLDHWVNGGFFFFEPAVLDYVTESSVLEQDPLKRLAADGRAARLPPRGLLGLHGHLQGCGHAQRPLEGGSPPWAIWAQRPRRARASRTARIGARRPAASVADGPPARSHARRSSPAPAASSAPGSPRACWSAAPGSTSFDRAPRSGRPSILAMLGVDGEVEEVEGDLRDAELVGKVLAEREGRRRLPPRRRDDRRHRPG